MSDERTSAAIETEIKQRLSAGHRDGLRTGQLKMPTSRTVKGKKYRQVLRRLCAEKQVVNLGTQKRPIYLLEQDFRPIERASSSLLTFARNSGRKLVSQSQFKKCLSPALRPYSADAVTELIADGRLLELRWAAQSLYCDPMLVSVTSQKCKPPQLAELVEQAYEAVVQDKGYPDVLIHDLLEHLQEVKVGDLVQHLQNACARGEAIPSEGDWSLSTEEERQSAVTIGGGPHLRIRLLEVA